MELCTSGTDRPAAGTAPRKTRCGRTERIASAGKPDVAPVVALDQLEGPQPAEQILEQSDAPRCVAICTAPVKIRRAPSARSVQQRSATRPITRSRTPSKSCAQTDTGSRQAAGDETVEELTHAHDDGGSFDAGIVHGQSDAAIEHEDADEGDERRWPRSRPRLRLLMLRSCQSGQALGISSSSAAPSTMR